MKGWTAVKLCFRTRYESFMDSLSWMVEALVSFLWMFLVGSLLLVKMFNALQWGLANINIEF